MRVYIAKGNSDLFISKEIISESTYAAFYGFSVMGWDIEFFESNPPEGLTRADVVVGWISQVKLALKNLGIDPPTELDYPDEIRHYLGRDVWKSKLNKIYTDPSTWPVFVKPVKGKQFTGKLITKLGDLVNLGDQMEDREIWCSTPVDFVSEWRGFVRYGQLIDCRCYKGDFMKHPNYHVIYGCIKDYKSQPAAFTIDVGITVPDGLIGTVIESRHETHLIEVNDGYAMGSYGLNPINYAKMISARWSEMVGIPDQTVF